MAKLIVIHKDGPGGEEGASEVFEDVQEVVREDGWLVIVKEGDGGEFGVNRDVVSSYWVAADEVFDAEAEAQRAAESGQDSR